MGSSASTLRWLISCDSVNRKRKGKLFLKNEEISGWKTHTNTHGNLIYFDDHRCLSRSEESKCMWSHGNVVAMSLPCFHIHLLSSDWERYLWSSKYINSFLCLCLSFTRSSLNFLLFFPVYCVIHTSVLSFQCSLSHATARDKVSCSGVISPLICRVWK